MKLKMSTSNLELLRHIKDETDFVLQTIQDKTINEIINDGIISRAIIRSLEIIGEAAKRLSEEFKAGHPQIEWKKMAGTRDKLIHDYFGVDYEIVWSIVETKLPALKKFVDNILDDADTQLK